jgi:hypothetical protein
MILLRSVDTNNFPTNIIVNVGVTRYPKSVGNFLISGFRIIGQAPVALEWQMSWARA